MERTEFNVDPIEANVNLGQSGGPTEAGWKIVTPGPWYFRNHHMADKALTVQGYTDKDFYADCTKAQIIIDVEKDNPYGSSSDLTVEFLERYLETQNIVIRPNELLIGLWGCDEHSIPFDPIADMSVMLAEFHQFDKTYTWKNGKKVKLSDEEYKEIDNYLQRKNFIWRMKPYMSDMLYKMWVEGGQRYWELPGTSGFRSAPDREWFLTQGLGKLVNMMQDTVDRLEKERSELKGGSQYVDLSYRINDCKSSIRAGKAVTKWILRHADEARKLAKVETDPKERERLETLATISNKISVQAPETFWEMMQLNWYCFVVYYLTEHTTHSAPSRPDQYWYPWYEKDVLIDKACSREEAAGLIAFYFMKYHEFGILGSLKEFRSIGMGSRDFSVLTIGGQKGDGSDATNDLSMLILDVIDGYRFHFPDVKVRWHSKFDHNNLKRVVEVMRTGMGSPSLRNDNTAIASVLSSYKGLVNLEEARSWAVVGCNTPGITIHSMGAHIRQSRTMNAMKPLEFALYNGKDLGEGWEFVQAAETGDPTKFETFEEFYQAFLDQWDWLLRSGIGIRNIVDDIFIHEIRRPFLSLLYKRCTVEGRDVMTLDTPWLSFNNNPGWVDTMDSLVAVKYWVYDKKKYTMAELITALKAEWEGYDEMRKDFKEAPKFGNNNDYADDIFSKATVDTTEIGRKIMDVNDEPAGFMNALIVTYMYHLAPHSGALPNGRKRGEFLCDGGINPHSEFDKGGPWDRMASAMKIDQTQFKAWIYNQKFDYNAVSGEAGLEKMLDFTISGLEGGMDQLQYNLVSKDILLDSKENPEKYPFLSVRISGYSAYFNDLPEYVQDAVIERVDHEL